jgi:thioredoxin reductase
MDVIIIGGGAAGLAAALTLGRMKRTVLLVDSGQPRNAPSPAMQNFLSRDGTPPLELVRIARAQLRPYDTVRTLDGEVLAARRDGETGFSVRLAGGEDFGARRLVLATGLRDELPAIEGLAALWGHGVLHCPYCHGFEVRDRPLAVLGSTPDRVRMALQLTRLSREVALCTNGEPLQEADAERLAARGVSVVSEPVLRVEGGQHGLERIVFAGGYTLDSHALFISTLLRQRTPLAEGLGCALHEDGLVDVDDFGRTTLPGVVAVGDMARRLTMPRSAGMVIAAAASGTVAAAMLDQELASEEFEMPPPLPPRAELPLPPGEG